MNDEPMIQLKSEGGKKVAALIDEIDKVIADHPDAAYTALALMLATCKDASLKLSSLSKLRVVIDFLSDFETAVYERKDQLTPPREEHPFSRLRKED